MSILTTFGIILLVLFGISSMPFITVGCIFDYFGYHIIGGLLCLVGFCKGVIKTMNKIEE